VVTASTVASNASAQRHTRDGIAAEAAGRARRKNIDQYNRTFQKGQSLSLFDDVENSEHKPLPYIVIVIDGSLMMVAQPNKRCR